MDYAHSPVIGILGALFTFGLAIFVHELGHFIFAKIGGVGVKEFAVGMGPKLISINRNGTDYSIRAVPFGGFVMMEGALPEESENEEAADSAGPEGGAAAEETKAPPNEKPKSEDRKSLGESVMEDVDALRSKPMYVKIPIFAAGVAFNFLAAMVAIGILYSVGFSRQKPFPPQVDRIDPDSALYEAGLRSYDRFVSINGEPIKDWAELEEALMATPGDGTATLKAVVEREDGQVALSLPPLFSSPENEEIHPVYREDPGDPKSIAFAPAAPAYVGYVYPTRAADRARSGQPGVKDGLRKGDWILSVNDEPVRYFTDMAAIIRAHTGEAIKLEVKRQGYDEPLFFYPLVTAYADNPDQGQIGIFVGNPDEDFTQEPVLTAFANAPARTARQTAMIAEATFKTLGMLFTNFKAAKEQLSGPVGIMTMAYKASREGFQEFLQLFILLNLALMILNLLPIPVLDGGHIAVTLIEGVSRRQIPPKILVNVYYAMAVTLILLAVMLTYRDIMVWWLKM